MKKIFKILLAILIVCIIIISLIFLFQDNTKLLEDRKYKDIEELIINSEVASVNFYKSDDLNTRVVIYGLTSDNVELIEGNKELSINKRGANGFCLINCDNKIDVYLPTDLKKLSITTDVGSINTQNIIADSINIKTDVGNISIGKTNVVNITTNVGSVSVKQIEGTSNSFIKTDVGSINIEKISNLKIESNVELGSSDIINSDGEFILKLETNVGSVKVSNYENKSERL